MPELGIRRSDGEWYAGTADHRPRFAPGPASVAGFKDRQEAQRRAESLAKLDSEYSFEVLPIGDVHAG